MLGYKEKKMRYRVLQRFLTKSRLYMPGDEYNHPTPGKFTNNLVRYGFIAPVKDFNDFEGWEEKGIYSKLTRLIIAPENYTEGDKEHFTFDQASDLEKTLDNGWRLPTRSEWVLLCEEFGTNDDGRLDIPTLIENLKLSYTGYVRDGSVEGTTRCGCYWSSTIKDNISVYNLNFSSDFLNPSFYESRRNGLAVRLVKGNIHQNE